jgi:DNA-binding response OmpR family regulator
MDKMLIAEDDIGLAQCLQIFFEKKGYLVTSTLDGEHALRWLEEIDKPDIIIVDIGLPDMNGLDLCKKIKENIYTRKIPVIILTGKNDNENKIEGTLYSHANLYLNKPIELENLNKAVSKLISDYKKEKQILRGIYAKNIQSNNLKADK